MERLSVGIRLGEGAAIFAALEKAGVQFQADCKRLGVKVGVRKLPK